MDMGKQMTKLLMNHPHHQMNSYGPLIHPGIEIETVNAQTGAESMEETEMWEGNGIMGVNGTGIMVGIETVIETLVVEESQIEKEILVGREIVTMIEVVIENETLEEIEIWTEEETMNETGREIEIETSEIETGTWIVTENETAVHQLGKEVGKVNSIGMSSLFYFIWNMLLSGTTYE